MNFRGAPEIRERKAQVRMAERLPPVRAHRVMLTQVLVNLVSNAIKFVARGVEPRVEIRAEPRDGRVRLWVEDNGIGIAAEYHERIFRMFERLNRQEDYPGTGIGLAIVRKATERMGGTAGVESEPGRGSRFWIELEAAGEL
jgi:signal transduction histidine kinase